MRRVAAAERAADDLFESLNEYTWVYSIPYSANPDAYVEFYDRLTENTD